MIIMLLDYSKLLNIYAAKHDKDSKRQVWAAFVTKSYFPTAVNQENLACRKI